MEQGRGLGGWLWLVPLTAYSTDALAWGLSTHVYFAQFLIWAVPLVDPGLWRAARRFPQLVMAGACLPDLMIVAGDPFRHSHRWETGLRLLANASGEEELAMAIGYVSHLLADVVAHNHFVPAHEALWINRPMVTHAMAEWAMDGHVRCRAAVVRPGRLLDSNRQALARFVAKGFACTEERAGHAIRRLAWAESLLRRSGLPGLLYRLFAMVDGRVTAHFEYYLEQTSIYLSGGMNSLVGGQLPLWCADPAWQGEVLALVQRLCHSHLNERTSLPQHFLHNQPQEIAQLLESLGHPAKSSAT
jgi:hypothetical protein